jgi:hypothetical protein
MATAVTSSSSSLPLLPVPEDDSNTTASMISTTARSEWIEELCTSLQTNDDEEDLVELHVNGRKREKIFDDADMIAVADVLRRNNNTITSISLCNVKEVTRAGVLSLVAA